MSRSRGWIASYFDRLGDALPVLAGAGVDGLALVFTGPAAANLEDLAAIGGTPASVWLLESCPDTTAGAPTWGPQ